MSCLDRSDTGPNPNGGKQTTSRSPAAIIQSDRLTHLTIHHVTASAACCTRQNTNVEVVAMGPLPPAGAMATVWVGAGSSADSMRAIAATSMSSCNTAPMADNRQSATATSIANADRPSACRHVVDLDRVREQLLNVPVGHP
jgi:hypothetical protein